MVEVVINRFNSNSKQTLGQWHIFDGDDKIYSCATLELPWKKNKRRVSCIPKGEYEVIKHVSPKFGKTFWIQGVNGRSEILVHKGNFAGSKNPRTGRPDILGCILVGKKHLDIDGDGIRDITSSSKTMKKLLSILPEKFRLRII